jgi:ABC-type uncharacterized transport system substrate-binding protein
MKKLSLIVAMTTVTAITALLAADKPIVVPRGKTYVQVKEGKEVKRFKPGQTMTGVTDCVKVECPKKFGADTVCWECRERAISAGGQ